MLFNACELKWGRQAVKNAEHAAARGHYSMNILCFQYFTIYFRVHFSCLFNGINMSVPEECLRETPAGMGKIPAKKYVTGLKKGL